MQNNQFQLIKKTLKDYEGVDINTLTLQEIGRYIDLKAVELSGVVTNPDGSPTVVVHGNITSTSLPQYYIGRRVFVM